MCRAIVMSQESEACDEFSFLCSSIKTPKFNDDNEVHDNYMRSENDASINVCLLVMSRKGVYWDWECGASVLFSHIFVSILGLYVIDRYAK